MKTLLIILIVIAALATAFVLVKGVMTMAQGKDISGEKSNRLMGMRVLLQAVAIFLVILLLLLSRAGGN